jgi:hypothetical protein
MSNEVLIATRKGLFVLGRDAGIWRIRQTAFLGAPVPMLLSDPRDGRWYVAVEHGHYGTKLHVSSDRGTTWSEVSCPAYPPKPEGTPDTLCPMRQKPIPWSLEKIWSMEAGGVDEPGTLWCGTIPGGLFRSVDSGKTWDLNRPLWDMPERGKWFGGGYDYPGIHSISVDPRDSRRVVISVSCGGVWETLDGGGSWRLVGQGLVADYMPPELAGDPAIQDPHRVVHCPAVPSRAWLQHHSGIFRSDDGGVTWTRITSVKPDFGFVVAVHPTDPDTAWFVPGIKDDQRIPQDGAMSVSRTRDGGRTFESLRFGLPQEHAYHLVYRHALEVSADGRTLVMGSTTGSVWVSENGGDSWERVSGELPPVYCVRMA